MPQVSLAPPSPCSAYPPLLGRLLPPLPPTVGDTEVPPLLRKRFVVSGYRPVGQRWRCYVLSLFQIHNETVNVWSHLLAAVCVAIRFMVFAVLQGGGVLGFRLQGPEGQGLSVDASSLPLVLHHLSAITYLSCSAAAHLLQSRSEPAHRSLFLVDRVGAALYQYGRAVALCLYSADAAWTQSMLGQVYLPAAALLAWCSCTICSDAHLCFHRRYRLCNLVCQVLPVGVAYVWEVIPLAHRLATCWWSNSAVPLHILQAVLSLLAVIFSCPVPECFFPGRCDIVGQGHQIFHVLLSLSTLIQQEALFRDFLWRRPALVRQYGEERLLLVCISAPCLAGCCAATTFITRGRPWAGHMKMQQ